MKRFLCAVLCTAMILSAGAVSIFAGFGENNLSVSQTVNLGNDYTVGDADSNGQVNSEDALKIKRCVAGFDSASDLDRDASDINADGMIGAKDVFFLKSVFAGCVSLSAIKGKYPVYKFEIGSADISEFVIVLPEGTSYDDSVYFFSPESAREKAWQKECQNVGRRPTPRRLLKKAGENF